ncbi:MAG TPA: FAD-dependent thymidylate synthase [Acidimicrobiales bacterium]|nr:FAD-dependent thymidylate synthase [Acidimicrobiales bacterium]
MLPYANEPFTPSERELLAHYFTNLDGPVFALVNLPEVVRGALFARYSRSSKSLRRLFLDEFVGDLDVSGDLSVDATIGLRRAEELYAKVFGDYGDDSVAQLAGVHLACEQASNVLTKVLERGRLMSYMEQSSRYIPYDTRLPSGHYRFYRDPAVLDSPLGARYVGDMDRMFDTYQSLLEPLQGHLVKVLPRPQDSSEVAYRRALRARAFDALRGLLPAGALSNVGIFGSAQAYEALLLHMRGHPLPEVREYGALVHTELAKVIPSFLARLERPERGGEWASYLASRREETSSVVAELFAAAPGDEAPGPRRAGAPIAEQVDLVDFDPAGEDKVLEAICYAHAGASEHTIAKVVAGLGQRERSELLHAYVGERSNRRHRPGRAFERTEYRFDVVADYGAFRDLQRHRLLTVEWQPLGTSLGATVPEVVDEAGLGSPFRDSLERSASLYDALSGRFPDQASYAVALAFRIRFSLQLNAREAMHLIELRSGPQGHPSYRRVAQQMHRQIAEVAGHRAIAASIRFADHSPDALGRLDAERRAEVRRAGRPGTSEGGPG